MKLHVVEQFTTIHNYIDMETMILRKGAVSAQKGEKVINSYQYERRFAYLCWKGVMMNGTVQLRMEQED